MGKPIIWSGANAKLINAGDLVDKYNNSLTDGGKVNYTWSAHGLTSADIGRPVRIVSANQLDFAKADTAANAEVAGFIYAIIDTDTLRISFGGNCPNPGANVLEGGGNFGASTVYFLSPTTAGKITAAEPTDIGLINKPIAVGTSLSSFIFINYRGSTVGSTNARTQISLANNSTTNMQNCAAYDAGSIEGWIYIDGTTDYRFYFNAPFSKYGAGGNYYISPSYVGDTPPAGFSITINSSGQSIVTLPSIAGFVSATCTYSLNAPAVGTNFPLSLNLAQLVPDGTAFATNGWNSGAVNVTMSSSSSTVQRISSPSSAVTVTLPTTGIKAGYQMKLIGSGCTEANYVRLNSSSGAEIDRITGSGFIDVFALVDSPTLSTDWLITNYRNGASLSFSDVTFSAIGGGTWGVDPGDFTIFDYVQVQGILTLNYQCGPFSITGTVTDLVTTLPARFKTFRGNQANAVSYNNTGSAFENGLVSSTAGTRAISVARSGGVAWTAVTNTSYFRFSTSLFTN